METELSFFVAANSFMEIMSAVGWSSFCEENNFFFLRLLFLLKKKCLRKRVVKVLLDKASFET